MIAERSPLAGVAIPGRYGKPGGEPGVDLSERVGLGIATVAARKGQRAALAAAVKAAYGVDLPEDSRVAAGEKVAFFGTGPGQWVALSETLKNETLAADLAVTIRGLASISDQSDGRVVVRIAGPRARDVLAKGLPIDLHPSVFRTGSAATSVINHIGAQIWQVDDAPTYEIAAFRGFAESFWHWLTDSAAEFGYRVEPPRG